MRMFKVMILVAIVSGLALGALSCQSLKSLTGPKATLEIVPAQLFLSPALIRKPVTFKGTGFDPKELVSVEMMLPPGLKMKGVKEGEKAVGIAYGTADEKGSFTAAMAPTATLNWFFQVGWTPLLRPNLKEARPIPPGDYTITATGLDSDRVATSMMKIVPPPKKK